MADDDTPYGSGNSWRLPTPSYQPFVSSPLVERVMASITPETSGGMHQYLVGAQLQHQGNLDRYSGLMDSVARQQAAVNRARIEQQALADARKTALGLVQHGGMPVSAGLEAFRMPLDRQLVAGGDASVMQERDSKAFNQHAQGLQHAVEAGMQFPEPQQVTPNAAALARLRGIMTNNPLDLRTAAVNAAAGDTAANRDQFNIAIDGESGRATANMRSRTATGALALADQYRQGVMAREQARRDAEDAALRARGLPTPQRGPIGEVGQAPGPGGVARPLNIQHPPPAPAGGTGAGLPPSVTAAAAANYQRLGAVGPGQIQWQRQTRPDGAVIYRGVGPNGQSVTVRQ